MNDVPIALGKDLPKVDANVDGDVRESLLLASLNLTELQGRYTGSTWKLTRRCGGHGSIVGALDKLLSQAILD